MASSSSTSTATRCARTYRRGSASRRRIATPTSSGSAVASRVTRHGGAVIVAAISPYEQARANARALVEEHGPFIEIHVRTSLDECARRDVNGLYAKAFAGEIKGFTGVDDPYEAPAKAEIVVDTEGLEPEESAAQVIAALEQLGLVPAKVNA